ncbi:MAG TPA: Cof-type HAD-IIB family hydrolase [Clostridiales bacterium]|nr:Cof-type HAD-IIB family hydrolase [Clostridiales bacterium]
MGKFEGCLLVSDIDGTLVHDGKIPQPNIEKIKEFIEHGGKFTIASGRSYMACRVYYEESGCNCPAITFNGAVVYDYKNENIIHKVKLPDECKQYLQLVLERFPSIGAEVHSVDKIFVLNRTDIIDWHLEYESLMAKDKKFEDIVDCEWTKALFASYNREELLEAFEFAKKLPFEGAYFLETAPVFFELTSKEASKGTALRKLAEYLNIEPCKVFAIGDYYNDIDMIKAAGISALAKEAPEDIKGLADYIACGCSEGAVADFIEYLEHNMDIGGN